MTNQLPLGNETENITGVVGIQKFGLLEEVSGQIRGVLDDVSISNYSDKVIVLTGLFDELKIEVARISKQIGYSYDRRDYNKRLSQSKRYLNNVSEQLIQKHPKLWNIIESILLIQDERLRGIIKSKIYNEYLLDLVYEGISDKGLKESNTKYNIVLSRELADNMLSSGNMNKFVVEIFNPSIYGFNLNGFDFRLFSAPELQSLSCAFRNIRTASFSHNNLSKLDLQTLNIIFSGLSNTRYLSLDDCHIHEMNKESITSIFTQLTNIKSISLERTRLGNMDKECLLLIFENLLDIVNIDLTMTELNLLDYDSLEIIFSNLQKVKTINLHSLRLDELDNEKLKLIFGYLGNVESMILHFSGFLCLSEEQIDIIFSQLINLKFVDLSFTGISDTQIATLKKIYPNVNFNSRLGM